MDNVLVDFVSGIKQLSPELQNQFAGDLHEVPNIFSLMKPKEGAIESFQKLSVVFDTYILSTASWENDTTWSDKLNWVKKYLGPSAHKRLILSHNKNLNIGDYLIDDMTANGADKFKKELIQFGSDKFPDWESVCEYLLK